MRNSWSAESFSTSPRRSSMIARRRASFEGGLSPEATASSNSISSASCARRSLARSTRSRRLAFTSPVSRPVASCEVEEAALLAALLPDQVADLALFTRREVQQAHDVEADVTGPGRSVVAPRARLALAPALALAVAVDGDRGDEVVVWKPEGRALSELLELRGAQGCEGDGQLLQLLKVPARLVELDRTPLREERIIATCPRGCPRRNSRHTKSRV